MKSRDKEQDIDVFNAYLGNYTDLGIAIIDELLHLLTFITIL